MAHGDRKVLRDGLGCPVPPRLMDVFEGGELMNAWCSQLDELRPRLAELAHQPYGRGIDLKWVLRTIRRITAHVHEAAPMAPCNCPVQNTFCEICNGSRWYTYAECPEQTAPPLG